MSCHPRRARGGLKMAASVCSGIGLATMLHVWPSDGAAANSRRDGKAERSMLARPSTTPVMAIVSINQQRVTVYDADGALGQAPVSTGRTGYETPPGIYTVLEKRAEHYSNLYDDASMPFMQRLTWSGIALHAGALPGYPASHGCIRLPHSFSERLFGRTKLGMRVIVVRDDIAPAAFAHPALFRPLPGLEALAPGAEQGAAAGQGPMRVADASPTAGMAPPVRPRASLRALAAAKVAAAADAAKQAEAARLSARKATIEAGRASKALRRVTVLQARAEQQLRQAEQLAGSSASERAQEAKAAFAAAQAELEKVKGEMQPKIDLAAQLREQAKEAAATSATAREEAREAARKLSPVSVFISRATQRLYVRQAREPLFDTPITIADAGKPMGTYVFTALAYANGEADLRWNVVSMYGAESRPGSAAAKRKRNRHAAVEPADHAGARAALDRISIPPEAAERISEMVAPGASLIVSDEGLSRETGKATEFIVVMSGEPQGGIKIRRRTSPEVRSYRMRPSYGSSPFGWSGGASWW